MPRNAKIDPAVVLAVFAETKSTRETARRLGVHEGSVLQIRRLEEGHCRRCGGPLDRPNARHCAACRQWNAAYRRARVRSLRDRHLCMECGAAAVEGRAYCAVHQEEKRLQAITTRRNRKARMGETVYLERLSDQRTRLAYGDAAVELRHRGKQGCMVCGQPYQPRRIHIHHIDGDHANGSQENLICLCTYCHRLVHHLEWHPNRSAIFRWIAATYPTLLADVP